MSAADKSHEPSHLSDAQDRLMDAALTEVAGGQSPPDLSSRIMAAYEGGRVSPSQNAAAVNYGRRFRWLSVATAASLLVGMGYLLISDSESNGPGRPSVAMSSNVPELVAEFNRLNHEQHYAEAENVARRLKEIAPDDPVAQQTWLKSQFLNRKLMNRQLANGEDQGLLRKLSTIDQSTNGTASEARGQGGGSVGAVANGPNHDADFDRLLDLAEQNGQVPADTSGPVARAMEPGEFSPVISSAQQHRDLAPGKPPMAAGPGGSERRVKSRGVEFGVPLTASADGAQAMPEGQSLPTAGTNGLNAGYRHMTSTPNQTAPTPTPSNNIGLQGVINDAEANQPVAAESQAPPADANIASKFTRDYKKQLPEQLAQSNTPLSTASPPSAYYLTDDIQYYAAGPSEFKLSREAAALSDQPMAAPGQAVASSASDRLMMAVTPRIIVQEEEEVRLGIAAPAPDGSGPGKSGDKYVPIVENPFIKAIGGEAVSTFSIDVDTASYSNVRQFLMESNQLPPADAVRIEELVNYFEYDYAPPTNSGPKPPAEPGAAKDSSADATNTASAPGSAGGSSEEAPFAAHVEVASCPWNVEHRLARIAVKGREMDAAKRPQSNLVFLVDVSGSMNEPAKLPLVVYGLERLTKELGENDHIAIVVYASSEGLVLPSTSGTKQREILEALGKLQAGGSTAGGAGIQLAYQIAEDHFIKGGTNRVILCTDGDFNVGVTSTAELQKLVEKKAKDTGVFLSVLGFGRGNLNDAMMEAIADHGNGNYHYVDNRTEARRVLVEQMTGTLVTIAKDVKIQVEFNPAKVAGYRLVGYENRMLKTEDFNDDKKDAGEIGAGHTVTALYEIVPAGKNINVPLVDDLKYQKSTATEKKEDVKSTGEVSDELLTLKMRYKAPDGDTSKKLEWAVKDDAKTFADASDDYQFASAVAGFGLMLRDSQYKGNLTLAAVLELAQGGVGRDEKGYRSEFLDMVRKAKQLKGE